MELNINLPKNIRIERAMFDIYNSNNIFLVGEGGNGVFLYDIAQGQIKQIYYSRIVTESMYQTSIKNLKFELFYRRGTFAEIDIYSPSRMANIGETGGICYTKGGFLYLRGKDKNPDIKIAPLSGNPDLCILSPDSNLLLFFNKISGGYVYALKTQELANLGFQIDFKFANGFDIISVKNSKVGEICTNSYIYYWLNSAVESFIIFSDKEGCIRYPDANKDSLIFIRTNKLFKCPLNLSDAVLSK